MIRSRILIHELWGVLCAILIVLGAAESSPPRCSAAEPAGNLEAKPALAEPGISRDGKEIAFVSGGAVWTVAASGGEAHLLISDAGTDSRPLYSPDGTRLAFISARSGSANVYVLAFSTGQLKRLTFDDAAEGLDGWSPDSQWIYFHSNAHDIAQMTDVFRVRSDGGTPMPFAADRYEAEFFAAPSPDGKTVAITSTGAGVSQWWRKGHSHLDDSEIVLVQDANPPVYTTLTDGTAKEMWPMWSADGKSIYYVSDRSRAENVWIRPANSEGEAQQLTKFSDGHVLFPSIGGDGKTIVFERNFEIWSFDTRSGQAAEIPIRLRGAAPVPPVKHLSLTKEFRSLVLSPDGKKVVFATHGQIFAASAKDGGTAARVMETTTEESEPAWAPDSKQVAYVSDRSGTPHLYLYDFVTRKEMQLTSAAKPDAYPRFSPDGNSLAFVGEGRELRALTLETKQERLLATGFLERPPLGSPRSFCFSPDSKWIAYLATGDRGFSNVSVVPVAGGEARQITFLPNAFSRGLTWSPDGTFLLFTTGQRTEPGRVARLDLIPRPPKFHEDEFQDLFKPETPKPNAPPTGPAQPQGAPDAKTQVTSSSPTAGSTEEAKKPVPKPVEIVFEGLRRRLTLLPVGVDVNEAGISADGKSLLMNASAAGQDNLYVYSLDELAKEPPISKQLTSTPGEKSGAQFTPDGKEVFYLSSGQIQIVNVETRQARPLAVTAEMDEDFAREKMEIFEQAWIAQRDNFFDPRMNGTDWNAVHAAYAPRVAAASNSDELVRLLNLMVGELNSSHSGVAAPSQFGHPPVTGHVGLSFDRAEYESSGKLRITEVMPLSPAALAGGVKVGEYLFAVNGSSLDARENLDELLQHQIGRKVTLTLAASPAGDCKHDVSVLPISLGAEKNLRYKEWVEERRSYVEKASSGRLGYVHMPDMSSQSLEQLYLDLDTQNETKQGVIIDVRNNNGGFVNVYAIDVLARRPYLTMTVRDQQPAPARGILGQRALERPTILVTNGHSLSDAEDFTEGYRALHLGKVVGEPTAGWIIYTSAVELVDGTIMRMPFIRVTDHENQPMELHPRPVDVTVRRPVGESYTGRDAQLDAAVRELLAQIDGK
ncbi:MAG: S41 family peptidase [Candidatus Acidiferrales bacterium]